MIRLKLKDLINAEPLLSKIIDLSKNEEISFNLIHKFSTLISKVRVELVDYYEWRNKLFDKYGKKSTVKIMDKITNQEKEEETVTIPKENTDKFNKYFTKLIETEIELTSINPFSREELKEVKFFSINDDVSFRPFLEKVEDELENRKPINLNLEED